MIDLHVHSNISDGSDPPERIPALAAEAGLSAVALSDHDSLGGVERARQAAGAVEVVAAVELSCRWPPGTMHALVYFVEPDDGPLQDRLGRLQQARERRNHEMIAKLVSAGLPITYEEVAAEAGGQGIGRPHAAAVLVAKGFAGSVQDAFDRYLSKSNLGLTEAVLSAREAASLAAASGGVTVLAHPLSLGVSTAELEATIADLAACGFAGIEALYGRYSPEQRQQLSMLSARHGLVASGGSDYHGTYKPDLSVGVGTGDLEVGASVLELLRERRA